MIKINQNLLSALFISPNPQPEKSEVGQFFNKLHYRIFPTPHFFVEYLMAQTIDRQYELATKIIQSLCFYANFPPPYFALYDVLCVENYQKSLSKKSDYYIPRDHYLHIVDLYLLGIYVFFYNTELYSQIVSENIFERQNCRPDNSKIDCLKDFLSEWKYFCLFHDVGYTAELLGNKEKDGQREEIILTIIKNSGFQSSFLQGKPISQISYLGTIEIMAKLIFSQFVIEHSKYQINSKDKIFRDIKKASFNCISQTSRHTYLQSFEMISSHFDDATKLEKIYSNQCMKVLLPILEECSISVIGFDKETKKIKLLSYFENGERVIAVLSGCESDPDISKLLNDPSLLLFDDYRPELEIEYYFKPAKTIEKLYDFIAVDYLSRAYTTAVRALGKEYIKICSEQQFLDFQYSLFAWLDNKIEPNGLDSPLKAHLDTWNYDIESDSSESILFNDKRNRLILNALNYNHIDDITKMCIAYLENQFSKKKIKKSASKPKTAEAVLAAAVDSFCSNLNDFANDTQTKNALLEHVQSRHLELLEDDVNLLELYSQLYVKLFHTINKSNAVFSYDYLLRKTTNTSFLGKCINEKVAHNFHGKKVTAIKRDYKLQHKNTADHGIFSAQYASGIFEIYRNSLVKATTSTEIKLLSILLNICGNYSSNKERYISNYDHIFKKTLYAIFVHNLYPINFRDERLAGYKTSITEPFAYFSLICDGLQQWNRPHALFPAALAVKPNEDASEEYNVTVSLNRIIVYEKENPKYKKKIQETIDAMTSYISGVDAYVSLGS